VIDEILHPPTSTARPADGGPDWWAIEERIAALLPRDDRPSPDRRRLLLALGHYAEAVVHTARRLGPLPPTGAERARALPWLERPLFVCGHHRTGTTLMRDLLDGHPELVVLPSEGTYLDGFPHAAQASVRPEDADRFAAEWICRFADPNAEPHFVLGRSGSGGNPSLLFARRLFGWQSALRGAEPRRAPFALLLALVAAFQDAVAGDSTPRGWVEKTPLNEGRVGRLARAFPQARFIQLVREPAATLASVVGAYRGRPGGDDIFRHARSIARSLRLAARNQRRQGERYLLVRYEDLSGAPDQEMERVRAFAGLAPAPSLTTPTVLGRPVRSNSSFARGAAGVVVPAREAPELPAQDGELLRAFAAGPARQVGYRLDEVAAARRVAVLSRELPRYAARVVVRRIRWARRRLAERR
jgi:hypothetical protein